MKCFHCAVTIHPSFKVFSSAWKDDAKFDWAVEGMSCPACSLAMIRLIRMDSKGGRTTFYAYPSNPIRPVAPEVRSPYREEFAEAVAVLSISPKASAALSRRCLQLVLQDEGHFAQKDLAQQIDAAIASGHLPRHLSDAIDAVRNIGNFAAHPMKSHVTGAIVDVEPGEAEWLIETIDGMFDFYLVQPALLKAKRDALNKRLLEIGKPELK